MNTLLPVALVGAAACFALRMLAMRRRWQLPTAVGGIGGQHAASDDRDGRTG